MVAVLGMRGLNSITVNVDQIAVVKQAREAAYEPCQHPGWYPIPHIDGTHILAYACADCAATESPDAEGIEWVPLGTEG